MIHVGRNVHGRVGIFPHNLVVLTNDPGAFKPVAATGATTPGDTQGRQDKTMRAIITYPFY